MHLLQAIDLQLGYDDCCIVENLSTEIPESKITAIVGANGSGKTTVLKAFARILKPFAGAVYLDGEAIHTMATRRLAQILSILPQTATAPDGLTVYELVSYGRFPHRRQFLRLSPEDQRMIDWALEVVELTELSNRPLDTLSGGQQQRVWIAMTLAQGARFLLLDEPTSHLDLCHQLEVMELLVRLNVNENKTIVMVLHDLNLAARFAHHMIALKDGEIVATGTPNDVMNTTTLHEVFGIDAHIGRDPRNGAPFCIPYMAPADQRFPGGDCATAACGDQHP